MIEQQGIRTFHKQCHVGLPVDDVLTHRGTIIFQHIRRIANNDVHRRNGRQGFVIQHIKMEELNGGIECSGILPGDGQRRFTGIQTPDRRIRQRRFDGDGNASAAGADVEDPPLTDPFPRTFPDRGCHPCYQFLGFGARDQDPFIDLECQPHEPGFTEHILHGTPAQELILLMFDL